MCNFEQITRLADVSALHFVTVDDFSSTILHHRIFRHLVRRVLVVYISSHSLLLQGGYAINFVYACACLSVCKQDDYKGVEIVWGNEELVEFRNDPDQAIPFSHDD